MFVIVAVPLLVTAGCSSQAATSTTESATQEPSGESSPAAVEESAPKASSFQRNVTQTDVPKPQSGTLEPVLDVGCRVFHEAFAAEGSVYFDCGDLHAIIAADLQTGQERWRFQSDAFIHSPIYREGTIYAMGEQNIHAIEPATGRELWRFTYSTEEPTAGVLLRQPDVANGRVYVMNEEKMFALEATTGRQLWEYQFGLFSLTEEELAALIDDPGATMPEHWQSEEAGLSNPVVAGDLVYITSSYMEQNGSEHRGSARLHAINTADGTVRWTIEIEQAMPGELAVVDGVLYVVDGASTLAEAFDVRPAERSGSAAYAIDAESGEMIWTCVSNDSLGDFVVSGGLMLMHATYDIGDRSDRQTGGRLIAIDTANGEERWRFDTEGKMTTEIHAAGSMVLFGSASGSADGTVTRTYSRDIQTGEHRWVLFNEKPTTGGLPPLKFVHAGMAYFLTEGDSLAHLYRLGDPRV